MSTQQPPAGAPRRGRESEPSAEQAPTTPASEAADVAGVAQHTIQPTRTSTVWAMIGVGVVLLAATLVFILQNSQRVQIRFLMAEGTLPLGVGLLFAVLLGALVVLTIGAARVLQLRRVARGHRRDDQASREQSR
jgi:lipopolysaccharide assembly protein A